MSVAGGIEQAQAILAADGSRLEVLEESEGSVHFRLDLEGAACADCVLPVGHLTTMITGVMREATGDQSFSVQIDDPRAVS